MTKGKKYHLIRFSADVIREALRNFRAVANPKGEKASYIILNVTLDDANWDHDSEDEFFSDYRKSMGHAHLAERYSPWNFKITTNLYGSEVTIEAPTRAEIEKLFDVFERNVNASTVLPDPDEQDEEEENIDPVIFIGHGHSPLWRDLKDHLHEKHNFKVEAYETGARAGHAVRDVIEKLMDNASFAILVMTGEDETAAHELRARQNVVHEAGLFQGTLGFARAIVLVEEGTEVFSNIAGIEQIRFKKGSIKETFGDVVATIRREFPEAGSPDE